MEKNFRIMSFITSFISSIAGLAFFIVFLIVGFIQLFAIMDGVAVAFGITGFFGFVIASLTAWFPLIGSILGIYGAVNAWDWELLPAILLFFWFVPVFIGILIISLIGYLIISISYLINYLFRKDL